MHQARVFLILLLHLPCAVCLQGQERDSSYQLRAVIYDQDFKALSRAHVINLRTHQGVTTDTLGYFQLPVRSSDSLYLTHISAGDSLLPVSSIPRSGIILLKVKYYQLGGAMVFPWGSSYSEFQEAVLDHPGDTDLGGMLGLQKQDPDYVPIEMDEKKVRSAGLLLSSPVSFFYYNFSKHARSARRRYWLEKDPEQQAEFHRLTSREYLSSITRSSGEEMDAFRGWLLSSMQCTATCDELTLLQEIYTLWERYQELEAAGLLGDQ